MSRTLSLAMLTAAFAQETNEVILPLLTIYHNEWPEQLRCAMSWEDIVSRGNTYYAYPFDLVVPDEDPDRPPQASITIDNISRQITAALESTVVAPTLTIEIVRASTPDIVEIYWDGLTLKEVSYNSLTISGTLSYENLAQERYPQGTFTPAYFPGLF